MSIANQTLTAYEGTRPVYATLVSTGRDQLKDPATSASTPRGAFRVLGRHISRAVDPREVQSSFDVTDAPWVLELDGFSLTGMYWSDGVGEAQSFHDVALAPIDAHRLFTWAGAGAARGLAGRLRRGRGADGVRAAVSGTWTRPRFSLARAFRVDKVRAVFRRRSSVG